MFEKKPPTPRAVALHDALLEAGCYNTLEERISVIPPDGSACFPYPRVDIEVDGRHHQIEPQQSHDSYREMCMGASGIWVIRFSNHEIDEDLPGVVERILDFCCCAAQETQVHSVTR